MHGFLLNFRTLWPWIKMDMRSFLHRHAFLGLPHRSSSQKANAASQSFLSTKIVVELKLWNEKELRSGILRNSNRYMLLKNDCTLINPTGLAWSDFHPQSALVFSPSLYSGSASLINGQSCRVRTSYFKRWTSTLPDRRNSSCSSSWTHSCPSPPALVSWPAIRPTSSFVAAPKPLFVLLTLRWMWWGFDSFFCFPLQFLWPWGSDS